MNILTLDFETYYDDLFTLKKMTTEAYVRDARFSALMLAYRLPNGEKGWVPQENIPAFLSQFDWATTAVLCHHAQFDGLVLSHHYGVKPSFWFDTIPLARAQLGNHIGASLESLAKHYGLEAKTVPYGMFKGRQWVNLDANERALLGAGAVHDCELTWDIFTKLAPGFPAEEFKLIDLSTRMFTEPKLVGHVPLFESIIQTEYESRQRLMNELGVSEKDLASTDKFCDLLKTFGVDVEYKGGKNGPIPALAKTDEFLKSLLDSDDEVISGLAEARMQAKSTISETRAARLASMGRRGAMCVYLKFFGAHTSRFSGGDSLNWQNFPGGHKSKIRSGILAPPGYLIATVDSSQGECRIVNYLAGQHDVIDAFREGRDVYSEGASYFFNKPINKKDNPKERQLGKIMELQLGFGSGDRTFQISCARGALGGEPIKLTDEEASSAVHSYRRKHDKVVDYWKQAARMIAAIAGTENTIQWGPMEVRTGHIVLPNGLRLWYPNLKFNEDNVEGWSYRTRRGRARIWGSKLVENVVQALHRVAVTQAILEINRESQGQLPLVMMCHDDASFLIPDNQHAQPTLDWLCSKMAATPSWLPGIPFAAEGVMGRDYGK